MAFRELAALPDFIADEIARVLSALGTPLLKLLQVLKGLFSHVPNVGENGIAFLDKLQDFSF